MPDGWELILQPSPQSKSLKKKAFHSKRAGNNNGNAAVGDSGFDADVDADSDKENQELVPKTAVERVGKPTGYAAAAS